MKATSLHNPFPARPDDPDERLAITQNGGSRLTRSSAPPRGGALSAVYVTLTGCIDLAWTPQRAPTFSPTATTGSSAYAVECTCV